MTFLVHTAGRLVLLLLQLKWPQLSKINFYYETGLIMIEQLIPFQIAVQESIDFRMLIDLLGFVLDYFHWWPSLVLSLSQIVI